MKKPTIILAAVITPFIAGTAQASCIRFDPTPDQINLSAPPVLMTIALAWLFAWISLVRPARHKGITLRAYFLASLIVLFGLLAVLSVWTAVFLGDLLLKTAVLSGSMTITVVLVLVGAYFIGLDIVVPILSVPSDSPLCHYGRHVLRLLMPLTIPVVAFEKWSSVARAFTGTGPMPLETCPIPDITPEYFYAGLVFAIFLLVIPVCNHVIRAQIKTPSESHP